MAITPKKPLQTFTASYVTLQASASVEASTGNVFFHDGDSDEGEEECDGPH